MEHQLLLKNGIELCRYLILLENCMEGCLPNSGYQIVWNENVVQGDSEMYLITNSLISCKLLGSCMYACLVAQSVQLFATLWTMACQVSLSMGFPRQKYWSGLPFPSPGDLHDPVIKLTFPVSLALQVDSLSIEPLVQFFKM